MHTALMMMNVAVSDVAFEGFGLLNTEIEIRKVRLSRQIFQE